jgi:hypothetical protein
MTTTERMAKPEKLKTGMYRRLLPRLTDMQGAELQASIEQTDLQERLVRSSARLWAPSGTPLPTRLVTVPPVSGSGVPSPLPLANRPAPSPLVTPGVYHHQGLRHVQDGHVRGPGRDLGRPDRPARICRIAHLRGVI